MNKEELKIKAKEFLIKHQNITSAIAKTTIYDGYIDCMIDYSNTETAALRKEVEELKAALKDLHYHCTTFNGVDREAFDKAIETAQNHL